MGKNAKKGKEKQQAMTSSTQQVKTTAVQRVLAEETIVEETEPSEAEDPLPIPGMSPLGSQTRSALTCSTLS